MADNKKETERAELHRTIWGYTKIVRNMITKKNTTNFVNKNME